MDDWNAELAKSEQALVDWRGRYSAAFAKRTRGKGLFGFLKRPSAEELEAAARAAREQAGDATLLDAARTLDEICGRYLEAPVRERALIRARVGAAEESFELLWSLVEDGPSGTRGPDDGPRFERALAALGIDDLRVDVELARQALGRLWIAGIRAGLDVRAHVARATELANPGMAGGGSGMRAFFEEFEGSLYFREHVEPHLKLLRAG